MAGGKRLLMIGGGGHCGSVLDCVLSAGFYEKIGIVDNDSSVATLKIEVVGNDSDLPNLIRDGWTDAFISVGSIGSTALRRKLYKMIKEIGFEVPVIIDPTSSIACGVSLGEGTFIGKKAVVNTGSVIGKCAILNTGVIVEHDCMVGEFSHISPGVILCGQALIGNNSHIGAGTVVRQGISIGQNVLIGAGSVVVKNISDGVKAFGNPCEVVG